MYPLRQQDPVLWITSVALPPLPEQRAIAAALSDVDALLAKLDELIAKKRDLKQAAMQQLLTGQTRLPGFSGEWEVKTLGDICLTLGRYFSFARPTLIANALLKHSETYPNRRRCSTTSLLNIKTPICFRIVEANFPVSVMVDNDIVYRCATEATRNEPNAPNRRSHHL